MGARGLKDTTGRRSSDALPKSAATPVHTTAPTPPSWYQCQMECRLSGEPWSNPLARRRFVLLTPPSTPACTERSLGSRLSRGIVDRPRREGEQLSLPRTVIAV